MPSASTCDSLSAGTDFKTLRSASLLVFLLLKFTVTRSGMSSVFLEQPNSGHLLSPIRQPLVLSCTVSKGFVQTWTLTLPDVSTPVTSDSRRGLIILSDSRIYYHEISSMQSQLTFNRTEPIEVTLACVATKKNIDVSGNRVALTIYGPPPTPANITSTENGPGSISISWAFQFMEEVTVNFTLTAINLNTFTTVMSSTQEEYIIFNVQDPTSCDTYNFTVIAVADSGSSLPSEVFTRSIHSVPDIAVIANSVNHSLAKTASNQFTLNITIQWISACPILNYTVLLDDAGGNDQITTTVSNTSIIIERLAENTLYTYYIQAENKFGISNRSAGVAIMTTDVQGVRSICREENSGNYLIQCSYVEGSDARGCVYLISSGGGNVTGTIARSNTEGEPVAVSVSDELLLYDWESDGTTGTLPIIGNITFNVAMCPVALLSTTTVYSDSKTTTFSGGSSAATLSFDGVATTISLTTGILSLLQI